MAHETGNGWKLYLDYTELTWASVWPSTGAMGLRIGTRTTVLSEGYSRRGLDRNDDLAFAVCTVVTRGRSLPRKCSLVVFPVHERNTW